MGFGFITLLALGVGFDFGAALALAVPTIPIPVMSPTESITESSFLRTATPYDLFHLEVKPGTLNPKREFKAVEETACAQANHLVL